MMSNKLIYVVSNRFFFNIFVSVNIKSIKLTQFPSDYLPVTVGGTVGACVIVIIGFIFVVFGVRYVILLIACTKNIDIEKIMCTKDECIRIVYHPMKTNLFCVINVSLVAYLSCYLLSLLNQCRFKRKSAMLAKRQSVMLETEPFRSTKPKTEQFISPSKELNSFLSISIQIFLWCLSYYFIIHVCR